MKLVLVLLALSACPAAAAPSHQAWYDFRFKGNKVGHLYALDEPTTLNDRPAIHVHRASVVTVGRKDEVVRMEVTVDAWCEPDGKPMRFKVVRKEGAEERTVEGWRDGTELKIRQAVGGNLRESKLPIEGLYFASTLEVIFGAKLSVGKKMSGRALDETEAQVLDFSLEVKGSRQEGKTTIFEVHQKLGPIQSISQMREGHTLRTEVPMIGAEYVETTRDLAVAQGPTVDIFSAALFNLPKALPRGDGLEALVVELRGKSGKRPIHAADARQKAKNVGTDRVELTLQVAKVPAKPARLPIKGGPAAKFLAETPYEPLKDERLVATTQKIVGGATDSWAAAKAINAFVHRHITNKSLARAFASAPEVLDTREGDCTEHAVLFSALAKIAGIPTKLATGLVYVGGRQPVFGYHEWVEVWTGSEWTAMDPTFGQDLADPTHIKFTEGQSDPDGLREAGMIAGSLIGELEISVKAFTVEGEASRPY